MKEETVSVDNPGTVAAHEVFVRPATAFDFPAIVAFGLPILEELGERSSREQLTVACQLHESSAAAILLVAVRGEDIVGVLGAQARESYLSERRSLFVDVVVIPPASRSTSAARSLFAVAEVWAARHGLKHLDVSVPLSSPWNPSGEDGYECTERSFRKDLS